MQFLRQRLSLRWLCLLLLALQFALAFGHHHSEQEFRVAQSTSHPALAQGGTSPGIDRPSAPHNNGGNSDHCAVCWSMAAAGAISLPTPLAAVLPDRFVVALLRAGVTQTASRARASSFEARAPPAVPAT